MEYNNYSKSTIIIGCLAGVCVSIKPQNTQHKKHKRHVTHLWFGLCKRKILFLLYLLQYLVLFVKNAVSLDLQLHGIREILNNTINRMVFIIRYMVALVL